MMSCASLKKKPLLNSICYRLVDLCNLSYFSFFINVKRPKSFLGVLYIPLCHDWFWIQLVQVLQIFHYYFFSQILEFLVEIVALLCLQNLISFFFCSSKSFAKKISKIFIWFLSTWKKYQMSNNQIGFQTC